MLVAKADGAMAKVGPKSGAFHFCGKDGLVLIGVLFAACHTRPTA
jgi:hypothetical protein